MRNRMVMLSLLLTGCVTETVPIPVHYQLVDNPEEGRVELAYQNTSGDTMCLLPEHWPNEAGKINQASGRVWLIVDHERFSIENFNTGYCLQGCAVHVAPGQTVRAFISYQDFNLPAELANEPKAMDFESVAFKCSAK